MTLQQQWSVSPWWVVEPPAEIERRQDGWYIGKRGNWFADPFEIEAVEATACQAGVSFADSWWAPGTADGSRFLVSLVNPGGWTARRLVARAAAWNGEIHADLAAIGCRIGPVEWQVDAVRELFGAARIRALDPHGVA